MTPIYAKEALFVPIDTLVEDLKQFVIESVDHLEVHEVEGELFRRVLALGRQLLSVYVSSSGTGYEVANPPLSESDIPMRYKGIKERSYLSIFGQIQIFRAAYAHPEGHYVYPLDDQLNLPGHKYSYLLLKWLQADAAGQDFHQAVRRFNEIFGFNFFPSLPQRMGEEIADYVEPFYEQCLPPQPQDEGSHLAISADCKGVRILKSERENTTDQTPATARRGRGEKPGIKKDAVVVADFSFDPEPRCSEELVKGLLNQFTQEEKQTLKEQRQTLKEQGLACPRKPLNKHVFATLAGKEKAFEHLLQQIQKRDPQADKPIIALLDGEPALEKMLHAQLEAHRLTHRLDAVILDVIHACEYLWDVATALYGEGSQKRVLWVEEKLYALLDSKVGYLIGGLRQIKTKSKSQLSITQNQTLQKTITYFENHRHMMDYATYLKKGYPIATGVIEGACGSLVKNRMEQSGMRWSIDGAQAVLAQRAVVKNGDWNDFWTFFIHAEQNRLYPVEYFRAA